MLAQAAARRRQFLLGVTSAGGFVVIGVGVLLWWLQQTSVADAARAERERAQTALHAEVAALDLDDAAQAMRAVRKLEETKSQWAQWPTPEFAQLLERAQAAEQTADVRGALQQAVQDFERQAAAPPRELAAWTALHDRGQALVVEAKTADKQLQQRLLACVDRVDEGYFGALRSAVAAGGADPRAVRSWLITAEDLASAKVAAAERLHDAAARKRWDDEFMALAKREDALVTAAYDEAAIAAVPWQDLLPGTQPTDWAHSATPGLEHKVEGGVLAIATNDAGDKRTGVVVLKDHAWRNCRVECEVTLPGGSAKLLLRAGRRSDPRAAATVQLATVETKGAIVLPAGQPTTVGLLLLGDRLVVTAAGRSTETRVPPRVRHGGLAFVVEPGTQLRVGLLKVKDLP